MIRPNFNVQKKCFIRIFFFNKISCSIEIVFKENKKLSAQ